MIEKVTMYRLVCDHDGCGETEPSAVSEFSAWDEPQVCIDDAVNNFWYIGVRGHYCSEHAPRCLHPDCSLRVEDDEWDGYCEDHAPELADVRATR